MVRCGCAALRLSPCAIAQAELSAICRAVGVLTPGDSVELHNLPLVINVKCRKREDSGDVTNEIRGFSKREIAVEKPIQGSSPTTPPWRR